MTKDMTTGNPLKIILLFSVPVLLGNLFQQFYNMVDSIVVGRFVGSNALGAVGATGSLNFLFFAMSFGIAAGVGVVVSQYFGADRMDMVEKSIIIASNYICKHVVFILTSKRIINCHITSG